MKHYAYQATDDQGKSCLGEIAAENVVSAVSQLEQSGMTVHSIQETGLQVAPVEQSTAPEATRTDNESNSVLLQRISLAIQQPDALLLGLQALVDDLPPSSTSRSVERLIQRIGRGDKAAKLLEDPQTAQWLPVIARGLESPGNQTKICQMIEEVFQENQNRQQRFATWFYPVGMLFVALLVLVCLSLMIVPSFRKMYAEMGLRLPMPTQVLIWFVDQFTLFLPRTTLIAASILVIGLPVCWFLWRSPIPSKYFGWFTAGSSRKVSSLASLCRMLAELLSLGATLPEALRIAGNHCTHPYLAMITQELAHATAKPGVVPSQTQVAVNLPPTLIYALGDDLRRPNVPLLRELATIYSERVRLRCEWSADLAGPIAVVGVGIVVLFIVISLFMPLVSMISALS